MIHTIDPDVITNLQERIHNAYRQLATEPGTPVSLTDLRPLVGGYRPAVDEALRMINRQRGVTVIPEANQKTLTDADRAAAVHFGGQDRHLISIS